MRNKYYNFVKRYRVFGNEGHRQKMTFAPSKTIELLQGRIIVNNSDINCHNDYSVVIIQSFSTKKCEELFNENLKTIFKDCNIGKVEEIGEVYTHFFYYDNRDNSFDAFMLTDDDTVHTYETVFLNSTRFPRSHSTIKYSEFLKDLKEHNFRLRKYEGLSVENILNNYDYEDLKWVMVDERTSPELRKAIHSMIENKYKN